MNALWFANHSVCGTAVLVGKIKPENIVYYEPGYSNENEVLVRPGSVEQIHFLSAENEPAQVFFQDTYVIHSPKHN